jgi:hypothetical protein
MSNRRNHSFAIGETYQDVRGTYKVISVEEHRIVYAYGDGIQHEGDAETKWRIHCNLGSEQNPKYPYDDFWRYEEVAPIFAEVIRTYGEKHRDFMTHEKIVAAFLAHPEAQLILSRPHDDRPNSYWVGVMKAHFSKKYNSGKSEYDDYFEPKEIGGDYAYRVRGKKTSPLRRTPRSHRHV